MYMHLYQKFMRHQKYCLNGLWVKKLKVLTHVVVNAFFDKFVEHLPQNKPYGKKLKKHDFYLWKLHLWRNWLPIWKVKTFVKFFSKCFSCDLTSMSQKENLIHPFEKWYFRVYIFQKITLLDMCNIFRSKLHTAGGLCDKSQIVSFLKTYQLPYLLAKSWEFCLHIFSEV